MKKLTFLKIISVFVLCGYASVGIIPAQTPDEARKAAFKGDRAKARSICRAILSKGYDADIAILMGRTYAWDKQYDSARIVLKEVLENVPHNPDAISALSDAELWSGKYQAALDYCNQGLALDSTNTQLLLKKSKINREAGDLDGAADALNRVLRYDDRNSEAIRLLERIRIEQIKNKVTFAYTYDHFDKSADSRNPWHLFYLQYARKMSFGTLIGRINYAKRFDKSGVQAELDAYPHFNENNYMYVNLGYSGASVFPAQKGGIEWFHSFPQGFEASAGGRILHFDSSKRVLIYTGSVGKYLGSYWFSIRSYLTPGENSTSFSTYFTARRYLTDPENFFGVRLGLGSSPDESMRLYLLGLQDNVPSGFSTRLKSQSVKAEFNHLFMQSWQINMGATLAREEYWKSSAANTVYGTNFTLEAALTYRF